MAAAENFLHTTHRTVAWFNKAMTSGELELAAPFQRNPVWTLSQKAYLIDTILLGLPIPELYMQDTGSSDGTEKHIVVDGQQRIRSVLEFLAGDFPLDDDEVSSKWRGLYFENLGEIEKKSVFSYKFVVRILPNLPEVEIRKIFSRLNRNVVALNEQELRNATYWGPFIKTIQNMADEDEFWSEAGIFSANDHRRMLDHEFISELAIAFLHGDQNKKDRLDHFYQLYEQNFESRAKLVSSFRKVTSEIDQVIPNFGRTRWKKKSDFYTLFLSFAKRNSQLPWPSEARRVIADRILVFGSDVDRVLKLDTDLEEIDPNVLKYARAVERAASDKANRAARAEALDEFVFGDLHI